MIETATAILKRTSAEPLSISKIILVENISHKEAKKSLDQLLHAGLIRVVLDKNCKRYVTTPKGLEFVSSMRKVMETYAGNEKTLSSGRLSP